MIRALALLLLAIPAMAQYRGVHKITIDHTKVANTDRPNYLLTINDADPRLATVANGGWVTNASGNDIVFASDSACSTLLNWDALYLYGAASGRVVTRVQVGTVSHTVDTSIYRCFGNPAITTFQGGATGAAWTPAGVWNAAWSLGNGTTFSGVDLTGNSNTASQVTKTLVAGQIGGGTTVSTSNPTGTAVTAADSVTLRPTHVSVEIWVKPNASQGKQFAHFFKKGSGFGPTFGEYVCELNDGASGALSAGSCAVSLTDNTMLTVTGLSLTSTSWQHVAITYSSTSGVLSMYVNGVFVNSATKAGTRTLLGDAGVLSLGHDPGSPTCCGYDGLIDDTRIANTPLSADEIATEYANESRADTFYSVLDLSTQRGVTVSDYTFPPLWPHYFNSQYDGTSSAPYTGKAIAGDAFGATYKYDGTLIVSSNDSHGVASGFGCSANLMFHTYSLDLNTATVLNCMSNLGGVNTVNTNGWSDGYSWKTGTIIAIKDGTTAEGLYYPMFRSQNAPPWATAKVSIMYSPDYGTTWCAPGHSVGAGNCSTTGDSPTSGSFMFDDTYNQYSFVNYEIGGTGTLTVDCQNSYIYMLVSNSDLSKEILRKVPRGSDLQVAANYKYYVGAYGGDVCDNANWSSSAVGVTTIMNHIAGTLAITPQAVYFTGWGYLYAVNGQDGSMLFYRSAHITGPWRLLYHEPQNASNAMQFTAPLLHTARVNADGSLTFTLMVGGLYTRDDATANTPYSPFFRSVNLGAPTLNWLIQ